MTWSIPKLSDLLFVSAAVDEACDKVEAALVYLENICEEQDLLYNKQAHHKQLAAYKLKKAHELEKIKSKNLGHNCSKQQISFIIFFMINYLLK